MIEERRLGMEGPTYAVLASGPSLTKAMALKACSVADKVIAINETWIMAPEADTLYACDWQWWGYRAPSYAQFPGERICGTDIERAKRAMPRAKYLDRVKTVQVVPGARDMFLTGPKIGAGGSSAFQATNLAVKRGAKRILLLGVDCKNPNAHWHPPHQFISAQNQTDVTMNLWLKSWRTAGVTLERAGVQVLNCSPNSALDCFPRVEVPDA